MDLYKAHNQWSTRPDDERFWSLAEMFAACDGYRQIAVEAHVQRADLRVEANDGEIVLLGKASAPARLTHFAFGQLSGFAGAPASYLRGLPATLAAQNLNHGLKARCQPTEDGASDTALLIHKNGDLMVRAATSERYARVWNADVAARLAPLADDGWQVPPARPVSGDDPRARAATEADCLALSRQRSAIAVKPGDLIAPAGLYASDKDMFAFLVHEGRGIANPADGNTPLARGFFVWNSEVGDCSFGVMTFLYDAVCGNHIVWGARDVRELRVRHLGDADDRAVKALSVDLRRYADESASDDEARIASAQRYVLGAGKDEVVDAVLNFARAKRFPALTATLAGDAYDVAERTPRYGAPNSAWAIAQGVTELSQQAKHADRRVALDRAAGKLLEVAF